MKYQNLPKPSLLATCIALALGVPVASAEVFTVNNTSDDVNTANSLRWAIDRANTNNNPSQIDRIDFTGVTRISAETFFSITESLLLNGLDPAGPTQVTIDDAAGGGASRLFVVENGTQPIDFEISDTTLHRTSSGETFITHQSTSGGELRLSNVDMMADNGNTGRSIQTSDANVTIESSTIDNFRGHIGGASMFVVDGNLTLRQSTVSNNSNVFSSGGAIEMVNTGTNTHTVDVESTTFMDNRTGSLASYGGGALRIRNTAASSRTDVTITDSTLSGNRGGQGAAIYLGPASGATQTLTINGSTFSDNIADGTVGSDNMGFGGAIFVDTGAGSNTLVSITIDDSSFSDNSATSGGGVFDLRIAAPTSSSSTANVNISNSTFSGNSAGENGGMMRGFMVGDGRANITFVNTTISGNSVTSGDGGAIHILNDSGGSTSIDMLHTTVTANNAAAGSGGGVFTTAGTDFTLVNSIVAGNLAANNEEISAADDVTVNFSLIGDQSGKSAGATLISGTGGLITDTDPLLGSLDDNGGSTQTHALGNSSPAIATADVTGSGSTSNMPTNDQRGDGFPRVRDSSPDLGAVEYIASSGGGGGSGALGWPGILAGLIFLVWRRLRSKQLVGS